MTMSMYSSYTPEDFNNIEEDIFGKPCLPSFTRQFDIIQHNTWILFISPHMSHSAQNFLYIYISIYSACLFLCISSISSLCVCLYTFVISRQTRLMRNQYHTHTL